MTPEQFLAFADPLPEAMLLLAADGLVLAANRAVEDRLGVGRAALVGRPLAEAVADPPDEVAHYLRACARGRALAPGALAFRGAPGAAAACRAEGALVRPRGEGEAALLMLRLTPKEAAVGPFALLNERVEDLGREVRRRREAEAAARREAERLRVTLHSIGDGVIVTDADGRVTSVNPVAEALSGWTSDAAAGRPLEEVFVIVNESTRAAVENPARRALREGVVVGLANHTVLIARDGTERPIDDSAAPIRADGGTLAGVVLVFRDVTGRRRAEEERRRAEERARNVLESIADGFFSVDRDWRFTYVNGAAEALLGRAPGDLIGKDLWEEYPGQIGTDFERMHRRVAATRVPESMAAHYPDHDRWYETHTYPAADGISIYFRDVSDRKRAEAEVARLARAAEQQRRTYETALSNTADFNYVFDLDGRFTFANRPLLALWGRELPDVVGKTFADLDYPPELAARLQRQVRQAIDARETVKGETPYAGAAGEREYEYILVPVLGAGGAVEAVAGSTRDITDRKRADAAVRERESQLRLMADSIPQLAWSARADGHIDWYNRGWYAYTGTTPEQMEGWGWQSVHDPEALPGVLARWKASIASGEPFEMVFPLRGADGAFRPFLTRVNPLRDADGRILNWFGTNTDIGDQVRAAAALREAEGRWRGLAESLPNLVWTDLPDGRCDYLSAQWEAYTGVPVAELLGLAWLERVLHPDDRERTLANWMEAVADRAAYDVAYRIRRRDGAYRWFQTRGVPIRDDGGRIVKWVGTCTDIEDQERAAAALRESEERFRQLADAMPQIVWTARPDGAIDYLNRRWQEFTGRPEGAGGDGWAEVLHPDDAGPSAGRWAESLRDGAPFEMEVRLLDRHRRAYRWHLIRTVAARDGAGAVGRWFGTATDIDGQKRAEEAARYLAEASAALAGVVDYESTLQKVANLAVPYFADWAAVDVAADDGGLRRLAVAHRDADKVRLAHELSRRYPPGPDAPGGTAAAFRTGRPEIVAEVTDEMLVRGARDERHLGLVRALGLRSYICVPLVLAGRPFGVLTFATAESGRRYAEADLALAADLANRAAVAVENTRLYQSLRDADRRKDEFLATLAHELRNPLAPIRNALQILKMPRADARVVERSREMMERQVHHLVRLVDDLLDVSRVMRGKIELRREPVELATVVARSVETAQPLIESQSHELAVALPPEPLLLDADPVRLAQVVGNLLTNAAKYTEPGGHIRLTASREGGEAVLRVRDDGIGIAPDVLPHVFDLFVQVDHAAARSQGGLGIGLTLVKNLVEMHRGTVEAHSAGLGAGCEFVVRLPLRARAVPGPAGAGGGDRPAAATSGHRLLVVDDNRDAADSLAMLLRLQGHEVRVAHDGPAALELAPAYRPDLVFLDIGMPGMDGHEVARRLRKAPGLGATVLAALTGWGQQEDRRRTAEAGFDHHLVKPPDPQAIEAVLAGLKRPAGPRAGG